MNSVSFVTSHSTENQRRDVHHSIKHEIKQSLLSRESRSALMNAHKSLSELRPWFPNHTLSLYLTAFKTFFYFLIHTRPLGVCIGFCDFPSNVEVFFSVLFELILTSDGSSHLFCMRILFSLFTLQAWRRTPISIWRSPQLSNKTFFSRDSHEWKS